MTFPAQMTASASTKELFAANSEARVRTIQAAAGSAILYVKI